MEEDILEEPKVGPGEEEDEELVFDEEEEEEDAEE